MEKLGYLFIPISSSSQILRVVSINTYRTTLKTVFIFIVPFVIYLSFLKKGKMVISEFCDLNLVKPIMDLDSTWNFTQVRLRFHLKMLRNERVMEFWSLELLAVQTGYSAQIYISENYVYTPKTLNGHREGYRHRIWLRFRA